MSYEKKFNVSIIGCGFLGGALSHGFSNYANIKIYDKYKDYDDFGETVDHGDIIFFCLPTPFYKDDDGIITVGACEPEGEGIAGLGDAPEIELTQ